MEAHIAELPFSPKQFTRDLSICMEVFTLAMALHTDEIDCKAFKDEMGNIIGNPTKAYKTVRAFLDSVWKDLGPL